METVDIDPDLIRDLHVWYLEARAVPVDRPMRTPNLGLGVMTTLTLVDPALVHPLDGPCRWCDPDHLWR